MKFRVVVIVFIVALPLFFYFLVNSGRHEFKHLQFFGPKQPFNKTENGKQITDTIYHTVADFNFTDLSNGDVSFQKYNPSYWVITFFHTQCNKPCLDVIANLQEEIQRNYKAIEKVKLISITTNPQTDNISVLRKFEVDNGIISKQWLLCSGDSLATDSLMQNSFFIKTGTDLSLENVFLVDPDKRIRGIYDGTDVMEMKRLKDEIKVLSYEYKQKEDSKK